MLWLPRNRYVFRSKLNISHYILGKAWGYIVLMLPYSFDKIRGYADIQNAVLFAGEYVDVAIFIHSHTHLNKI